jgi:hypothetical protein
MFQQSHESDIVEGARIDRRIICSSGTPLA